METSLQASATPSCLLCFYSSHPRIVSFSAHPSLVFVTHKLAVETTIPLVCVSLYVLRTRGTAQPLVHTRMVYTEGEFQTDHHWVAELPW